jgi:chemotaxis protein histidine kinase CheA
MYGFAVHLIKQGKAYIDSSTEEEIREARGTVMQAGHPTPFRDRSVAENLDLFQRMRAAEFPDGAHVLRGKIDLASTPGQGTQVTLRLPLTLAIIEGLLVRVGRGRYIIPLSAVEECVELSERADKRSNGRNFLNIRGDLVPFLRLRELFGSNSPPDAHQKVVIVSAGETKVGLVIDQIIGSHQTVIKSLSKLHADVGTFSGATILGDGTTALILDIAHVVELGHSRERGLAANQRAVA